MHPAGPPAAQLNLLPSPRDYVRHVQKADVQRPQDEQDMAMDEVAEEAQFAEFSRARRVHEKDVITQGLL